MKESLQHLLQEACGGNILPVALKGFFFRVYPLSFKEVTWVDFPVLS